MPAPDAVELVSTDSRAAAAAGPSAADSVASCFSSRRMRLSDACITDAAPGEHDTALSVVSCSCKSQPEALLLPGDKLPDPPAAHSNTNTLRLMAMQPWVQLQLQHDVSTTGMLTQRVSHNMHTMQPAHK